MMILPLLACAISSPVLDDSYEENDTCADAAPLVVPADGQSYRFDFVSSGPGSATGADEDWFSFDVPAGHAVRVFTAGQFPGDPGVDVILRTGPQCGTILDTGFVSGPALYGENDTAATVPFQLQFQPTNPLFAQENIRMNLWVAPLACPGVVRDAFEPNQTADEAAPLPAGLHRGLTLNGREDRDYYEVAVPIGGTLQVGFGTRSSFGSPASCTVRDSSGAQQVGAVPSAGGVRSFVNNTGAPFLLLDVQLNNASSTFQPCELYDLYVTMTVDPCAGIIDDAFEAPGNDTRADSVVLGRGRYRGLTLTGDDEDWYAFDVPPGFGLKITVAPDPSGDFIRTELHEEADVRVYQRRNSTVSLPVHHYGNPSTSGLRRLELRVARPAGSAGIGCVRYDMGVQIVPEIQTQALCTGSPDLQWGAKTVDLFGSIDPNIGLLWVTTEGLEPQQLSSVSIYVGPPVPTPPASPIQWCVAEPRVQWYSFTNSLNRNDSVVDETYLVPLMGTTLALQYLAAENGLLVSSETVTFVVQ